MPTRSRRRNRVDPWGDLHAVAPRGMFTGNRGCLVDDDGAVVRHHRGSLWICCLLRFRGWRHPLAAPGVWTPLFFLDDAVALAAGHRPCGLCRRDDHRSYRGAVSASVGHDVDAKQLDRMLTAERLRRGRSVARAGDRKLWRSAIDELPAGTVVLGDGASDAGALRLLLDDQELRFTFGGWTTARPRRRDVVVDVLTPPTSVAALRHGFTPVLHPSAALPMRRGVGVEDRLGDRK